MGALIPSFGDFLYYYQIEISGFSQVTYSMLGVLGFLTLLISTFIYNGVLKNLEMRNMMITACAINLIGSATTVLYTKQLTFGLSPLAFVCLTSTVTDTLYNAYTTLPAMVLFAKLIPENVESSMFALMTGLLNFSNLFASKELGLILNKFVGVYYTEDSNNLEKCWQLYLIQACCCVLPMMFVWLLPTKTEIKKV